MEDTKKNVNKSDIKKDMLQVITIFDEKVTLYSFDYRNDSGFGEEDL